jgi:hypothetical protein
LRNRTANHADRDRFPAPRFGQRALKPCRIACADQGARKHTALAGFGSSSRFGPGISPDELANKGEKQHRQGKPLNRSGE